MTVPIGVVEWFEVGRGCQRAEFETAAGREV